MKQILFAFLIAAAVAIGCNRNSNETAGDGGAGSGTAAANERVETLAGDVQKTWKAKREENAAGDKERLDRDERKERVIFYTNGNVTMTSDETSRQGKWTLNDNTLAIQFDGANVTENFTVVELDKNTLHLRAADGYEMKLKPE